MINITKLLSEIGEMKKPDKFRLSKTGVEFTLNNLDYQIIIAAQYSEWNDTPDLGLFVDFKLKSDTDNSFALTNNGNPLSVVGVVAYCLEQWIHNFVRRTMSKEHREEFGKAHLRFIRYNPKFEHDNDMRRDKLYMVFIKQFAKKYKSEVTSLKNQGGMFNPPIQIGK